MRHIDTIVIHCSATKEGQNITSKEIKQWHKQRGFNDIGYHYVILLDGTVEVGRPLDKIGAHVSGHNTGSIGICYVGGLDKNGKAKDTRTPEQKKSMDDLVNKLCKEFNIVTLVGHRDLSPDKNNDGIITKNEWIKECPCFDVREYYKAHLKDTIIKP